MIEFRLVVLANRFRCGERQHVDNASSSAVAPRVALVAPVEDIMLMVGSVGASPGETGTTNVVPPFAVLKSVGSSTNAK